MPPGKPKGTVYSEKRVEMALFPTPIPCRNLNSTGTTEHSPAIHRRVASPRETEVPSGTTGVDRRIPRAWPLWNDKTVRQAVHEPLSIQRRFARPGENARTGRVSCPLVQFGPKALRAGMKVVGLPAPLAPIASGRAEALRQHVGSAVVFRGHRVPDQGAADEDV